jgi:hypothetical protein
VRIREAYPVEAVLQPGKVLWEPERLAAVHRDEFVDAVAVDEAAVEDGDPGVFDGKKRSVEINDHCGLRWNFR